jgi:hypothetical protein
MQGFLILILMLLCVSFSLSFLRIGKMEQRMKEALLYVAGTCIFTFGCVVMILNVF